LLIYWFLTHRFITVKKKKLVDETAAAKRTGFLRYIQTQEHPGSKASGETRRGAPRAAAGTIFTGSIAAAYSNRPAPMCG
jgi:hypothetical protein